MTELENQAHAQKTLLSSDAMRLLIQNSTKENRKDTLNAVIAKAKETFPTEDGWMVLNLTRMESLLGDVQHTLVQQDTQEHEVAASSLAEAMVTGNVAAAYKLIDNRPMVALADATADFDAVYRARKGQKVTVSHLLIKETEGLTNAQLEGVLASLTGALDGTYTDEAYAVKMAVLKAVKILSA